LGGVRKVFPTLLDSVAKPQAYFVSNYSRRPRVDERSANHQKFRIPVFSSVPSAEFQLKFFGFLPEISASLTVFNIDIDTDY
jgi:hypothetical protein